MALQKKRFSNDQLLRYLAVGMLAAAAFLGAYRFAQAKTASAEQTVGTPAATAPNGAQSTAAAGGSCCAGGASGSGGGSCCGGGGQQTDVAGATTVSGGVQKVTIDLTGGSYSPNDITAKAGVPLELDFKGPASGCNGYVVSQQLGFQQDVSNGGTIKIGALSPGTYQFTCSMGMYTAQIVVK